MTLRGRMMPMAMMLSNGYDWDKHRCCYKECGNHQTFFIDLVGHISDGDGVKHLIADDKAEAEEEKEKEEDNEDDADFIVL